VDSYYDQAAATSSTTTATHKLVPFEDLREAEIDLAVGRLQLLILTEAEGVSRFDCEYDVHATGKLLEWYLLCDLPDYDLMSAALSYCLKGQLAESPETLQSSLINSEDMQRFFPCLPDHAASLFAQMSLTSRSRLCVFPALRQFPGLAEKVNYLLQECGGSLAFLPVADSGKIALAALPIDSRTGRPVGTVTATRLLRQAVDLNMSWAGRLQKLIASDSGGADNDEVTEYEGLSQLLASEILVVPLGVTRVVVIARPEAHSLRCLGRPISFRDFYLVKP
jgi:hypothetical protein